MKPTCPTLLALLVPLLCSEAVAEAQDLPQDPGARQFAADQIEQLVAPIALYPDSLLTQVLMAATYPLEIVEADRFMRANQGAEAQGIETALAAKDWDLSIKVLCGYPELLQRLSDNLDWTRDLGDAFLGQKAEVLDAVQQLRGKAREAARLTNTPQEAVTVRDDRIIVIEAVNPDVVYVPLYSPLAVYGGWAPRQYYYPGLYASFAVGEPRLGFRAGLSWGSPFWGMAFFGRPVWSWGRSDVFVDVNLYNRFGSAYGRHHYTFAPRSDGMADWRHDPEHRQGVRYRDDRVGRRITGREQPGFFDRNEVRGYPRRGAEPQPRDASEPGRSTQRSGRDAAVRRDPPAVTPRGGDARAPRPEPTPRATPPLRGGMSGVLQPRLDRAASDRGSRERTPQRGSSGQRQDRQGQGKGQDRNQDRGRSGKREEQ